MSLNINEEYSLCNQHLDYNAFIGAGSEFNPFLYLLGQADRNNNALTFRWWCFQQISHKIGMKVDPMMLYFFCAAKERDRAKENEINDDWLSKTQNFAENQSSNSRNVEILYNLKSMHTTCEITYLFSLRTLFCIPSKDVHRFETKECVLNVKTTPSCFVRFKWELSWGELILDWADFVKFGCVVDYWLFESMKNGKWFGTWSYSKKSEGTRYKLKETNFGIK